MVMNAALTSHAPSQDLPWDRVWEYVLGDEDDVSKASNDNKFVSARHIDTQTSIGTAANVPSSSFNTPTTQATTPTKLKITAISPQSKRTASSPQSKRTSPSRIRRNQQPREQEKQQRDDVESSKRRVSPNTLKIGPSRNNVQRERETSPSLSTAASTSSRSSGRKGSPQRKRNDNSSPLRPSSSTTSLKSSSSSSYKSSRSSPASPQRKRNENSSPLRPSSTTSLKSNSSNSYKSSRSSPSSPHSKRNDNSSPLRPSSSASLKSSSSNSYKSLHSSSSSRRQGNGSMDSKSPRAQHPSPTAAKTYSSSYATATAAAVANINLEQQGSNGRKVGLWRRTTDEPETHGAKPLQQFESGAKREWRTSYLRNSHSSSPKSASNNSHSTGAANTTSPRRRRDVQSFRATVGLEPLEATIEQQRSASPDTTAASENSEGPLLNLFMCSGDDPSSGQSSGACGTENESSPSHSSTSQQQSIMHEGAPGSWGFLDTATNSSSRTLNTRSSSSNTNHHHQQRYHGVKKKENQSSRDSVTSSSSSGIRILDTIANGIEDFLEPNFDAKPVSQHFVDEATTDSENTPSSSTGSSTNKHPTAAAAITTATRHRGRRPSSMTITSLKYSHGDRSSTLSPISEGTSIESDDSSNSEQQNDINNNEAKERQDQDKIPSQSTENDAKKGGLEERDDVSGMMEKQETVKVSAFVPTNGAVSSPAERHFRGLRIPKEGDHHNVALTTRSARSSGPPPTSYPETTLGIKDNDENKISNHETEVPSTLKNEEKLPSTSRLVASLSDNSENGAWERNDDPDDHMELIQQSMLVRQRRQQEQLQRSCVPARFNNCFLGRDRRTFLPVNTFASNDAGDIKASISRELSARDTVEMFPKSRLVTQNRSKLLAKSSEDNTAEEICDTTYLQQHGGSQTLSSQTADIQSLYEYEYDGGPHMSVLFDEFGDKPEQTMKLVIHDAPPEKIKEGLIEYNKVVLKVEASTVSQTDCAIREGKWEEEEFFINLPATPGVDVVGKIFRIDDESSRLFDLNVGDRVMSLVKHGGNSRYLTVDPSKLVKISDYVDPAEAVCLVETYLHAFQLLHFGQSRTSRYRPKALQEKTILVIGDVTCNLGRAIATLSFQAGCCNVFGTAKEKHFETVSAMGVHPLETDTSKWSEGLEASVDLLVHLAGRLSPSVATKVLRQTGNMIISTAYGQANDSGPRPQTRQLTCSRAKSNLESRVSRYNVFRAWDSGNEFVQQDLQHLASLLENKEVVPSVLDRISLSKVGKAHELLATTRRHSGFIVCEPWLVSKSRTLNL